MLDVEPPAGFRTRVLRRIDADRRVASGRHPLLWLGAPLAAAAAIAIAILLPTGVEPPQAPVARVETPPVHVPLPAPQPSAAPAARTTTPPRTRPAVRRGQRIVTAASVADGSADAPLPGFPQVPSLSVPELSVSEIRRVAAVSAPTQLGVQPIAAPAPLDLEPLPLSPRDRQEQE